MKDDRLRLGLLGTGKVTEYAVLDQVRQGADVVVTAVASRDLARAQDFAQRYTIDRAFGSYEQMLAEADIDAVYNALPNSLHREWTLAALKRGFPVLCEKPFASNAVEATEMARAAEEANLLLIEAKHWQDHPIVGQIRTALRPLGRLRRIDAVYSLQGDYLPRDNHRFNPALSGGWTMDQGCYCVDFARFVTGAEPLAVLSATATLEAPGLDGGMEAELLFPGDVRARIGGSMIDVSVKGLDVWARVEGDNGVLHLTNPYMPGENPFTIEQGAVLRLELADGSVTETRGDLVSSWRCQLDSFARRVREPVPVPHPAWDSVHNMKVIDDIYSAAGLRPRGF